MSRRGQQLFNSGSLRICVHAGGRKYFEVSTQRRGRQLTRPAPCFHQNACGQAVSPSPNLQPLAMFFVCLFPFGISRAFFAVIAFFHF